MGMDGHTDVQMDRRTGAKHNAYCHLKNDGA